VTNSTPSDPRPSDPNDPPPSTGGVPAGSAPAAALPAEKHHDRAAGIHQVTFTAFPKLLFIWPLILAGFVFWPLSDWGWVSNAWLGWLYLWILIIVVLTISVDVNRNYSVFWLVVVALFWITGRWLKDVKGITVFGNIYHWFELLKVEYSRGFGLSISLLLVIPYIIMIIWARLNDRWRITHNEFDHYSFGRTDDSLGRGAKTIRTTFPDMFEFLLGMAGTLIVYNASGNQELRRISNVMFLPMVRRRLDQILERTAITQMAAVEDDDEA
jgi:hypothetical protein